MNTYLSYFLYDIASLEFCSPIKCTRGCKYCFAQNMIPYSKNPLKLLDKMIDGTGGQKTAKALFNAGFPIILMDKCDPYDKPSYPFFLQALKKLAPRKNGLFIQSKGGTDEQLSETFEVLAEHNKKALFVFSFASDDDKIIKQIESNTPSISQRKKNIEQVIKAGHKAVLQFAPFLSDTFLDFDAMIDWYKSVGGFYADVQLLHGKYDIAQELLTTETFTHKLGYAYPRLATLAMVCIPANGLFDNPIFDINLPSVHAFIDYVKRCGLQGKKSFTFDDFWYGATYGNPDNLAYETHIETRFIMLGLEGRYNFFKNQKNYEKSYSIKEFAKFAFEKFSNRINPHKGIFDIVKMDGQTIYNVQDDWFDWYVLSKQD